MKYLCLLLFLAGSVSIASGQAAEPSTGQPKRWQLSASVGHNLSYEYFSQYYQFTLQYRVARWLDVGVHLGAQPITDNTRSRGLGFDSPVSLIEQNIDRSYLGGFQPRVNYRVGQGDISLALTLGAFFHHRIEEITSPDLPGPVNIHFKPRLDPYYQFELAYTYWASKAVGLKVSFTEAHLEYGYFSTGRSGEPIYELDRIEGDISLFDSIYNDDYQQSSFRSLDFFSINMGITIRPF